MAGKIAGNVIDLLPYASTREAEAIEAILQHGSGKAAAKALGLPWTTVHTRLTTVRKRMQEGRAPRAAVEPPRVDGAVRIGETHPAPPGVRRYLLTCAQNNTHVHDAFWQNLLAARDFFGAELKVARFSYNVSAYGQKAVKVGRTKPDEGLWFDPRLEPFVCDDPERHGSCRYRLAPDLLWCAEMNILPTAVRPLSGLDTYAGASSGIFPHAKIALESYPTATPGEAKMNFTTGACTLRNYIQKKEGIKAEFHHAYGALLVEVDGKGNWWARHLNATNDGAFYDLTRRFSDGQATLGHRLEGFNPGDVHASEIDPDVRELLWAPGGAIDALQPRYQILHDVLDFRARNHHEARSYEARMLKAYGHVRAGDSVAVECETTRKLLRYAVRPWCETVAVNSNHDRFGERWLEESDYRHDPVNAEFFLEAQLARTRALKAGRPWLFAAWACATDGVRFLGRDEPFVICADTNAVQCGWHGDEGPNGARGTTQNLLRVSQRINKGHDHTATIRDAVYSAGACARRFDYEHGPSSHSISHILTYASGKRAIVTQRAGKLWL